MAYVDGFVLPVPKKNKQAYLRGARKMGKICREHGALEYRECIADDAKGIERLDEVITVTLADEGGRTRLKLHAAAGGAGAEAAAMLRGMDQGWSETLDRLHERSSSI
jgi:uncharacterized protein YndB with AHSA1/START domain